MQNGNLWNKGKYFVSCVVVGVLMGFLYAYLSPISYQVRVGVEMQLFLGDETNLEQQYYGFKTAELFGDSLVFAFKQAGLDSVRLSPLALEVKQVVWSREVAELVGSEMKQYIEKKQGEFIQGRSALTLSVSRPEITVVRMPFVLASIVGGGVFVCIYVGLGYVRLYRRFVCELG